MERAELDVEGGGGGDCHPREERRDVDILEVPVDDALLRVKKKHPTGMKLQWMASLLLKGRVMSACMSSRSSRRASLWRISRKSLRRASVHRLSVKQAESPPEPAEDLCRE